jgi:hypothetical protein
MITLPAEQAATQVSDSTALVKGANGISYLISCWHDESAETILARAARFYGQEMAEVVHINQIWQQEETEMTTENITVRLTVEPLGGRHIIVVDERDRDGLAQFLSHAARNFTPRFEGQHTPAYFTSLLSHNLWQLEGTVFYSRGGYNPLAGLAEQLLDVLPVASLDECVRYGKQDFGGDGVHDRQESTVRELLTSIAQHTEGMTYSGEITSYYLYFYDWKEVRRVVEGEAYGDEDYVVASMVINPTHNVGHWVLALAAEHSIQPKPIAFREGNGIWSYNVDIIAPETVLPNDGYMDGGEPYTAEELR